MALQAAASVFAPAHSKCYAGCEKLDYQDLIVTKCSHIFCKACLGEWLDAKHTCPLCNKDLSPITNSNVRQRGKDPQINQDKLNEGMQHSSFKLHLERFTHYIQNDSSTLQEKLAAAKAMKISSCEKLKAEKARAKPDTKDAEEDQCAICHDPFPQMYFISQDADETRIGRFMHDGCWQGTAADKSVLLEISAPDMVKVSEQLSSPREQPAGPIKPSSPVKVFFIAIILPVSIWALAMNNRIYHNKSAMLFVLSIPALIIFKIFSLFLNGIKAILTDKRA
jgi:hypothetical protein